MADDSNLKFTLTCSPNILGEEDLGIPGEEGNCELGFYDNILLYIHEMLLNWKNLKKTQNQINLCLSRQKIPTANYSSSTSL